MSSPLDQGVTVLRGVGPARAALLRSGGIQTVGQLLYHLPRAYRDRTRIAIADVAAPGSATIVARVVSVRASRTARGLAVVRARLDDGTGTIQAVWFGQPYLVRSLRPGSTVGLSGPVVPGPSGVPVLRSPELLPAAEATAGGLAPVYPVWRGMGQGTMCSLAAQAASAYAAAAPEILPPDLRDRLGLPDVATALRDIHRPPSAEELRSARRRMVFEGYLVLQLALLLRRDASDVAVRPFCYPPPGALLARFLERLPFALTAAQERVLAQIETDLGGRRPMRRLVQGDVGSGKTVVCAAAMLRAVQAGRQAVLMAPTEILAEQHAATLQRLCGDLVPVALVTGGTPAGRRARILAGVAAGEIGVLVGTHALLQPDVLLPRLGMVVIDEQHRFGVRQRDALTGGRPFDLLVTTATPIPRSMALVLYGDLEHSVIDALPPGRAPVGTYRRTPGDRKRIYAFVAEEVAKGHKAYVICPLITPGVGEAGEPEVEPEDDDVPAAVPWAENLRRCLPGVRIGLLHGRLPQAAKEAAMGEFVAGDTQVLVATTVVEVGVDVPDATVMVIEGADRFGLAQLHQLRGRVGRGPYPSRCILVASGHNARLEALTQTNDGFAVAEEDLRQRGPGEVLGTRQSGLPDIDPRSDADILREAGAAARDILRLGLDAAPNAGLRQAVGDFLAQRLRQPS